MHTHNIGFAVAAMLLSTTAFASPDFSNGGSFQIDGSFTPNQVGEGQQNNQQGSASSVINSVASDIASVTNSLQKPKQTLSNDNGFVSNSVLSNQQQDVTVSGVAQPTMGMNMLPNNGTAPFSGAAGIQVPEFFTIVVHLAGTLGLL